MKILFTDFNDFYVEEVNLYNACKEVICTYFYVKIARYGLFGQKRYFYYYEWNQGYDSRYKSKRKFLSKEFALKSYKEFLKNLKTSITTTKHREYIKLCDE
jgi:hypothetical protein